MLDASGNEPRTSEVIRQLPSFSSENAYFSTTECTVWNFCCSVVLPPLERIYKSYSQRQNTCLADKQPIDSGK